MTKIKRPSEEILRYIRENYSYSNGTIDGPQKNDIGDLYERTDGKFVIRIGISHNNIHRKHRRSHLVWFLCKGYWPLLEIDHIDRDLLNDNIDNLREVTHRQIQINKHNYRGYKGFSIEERKDRRRVKKYRVRNQRGGVELGNFKTREECEKVIDEYLTQRGLAHEWGYYGGNDEQA